MRKAKTSYIRLPKAPKPGEFPLLLLTTEIWRSPGGIQRYMTRLVSILGARTDTRIVTLLDRNSHIPPALFLAVACCGGSKWRFFLEAARVARSGGHRTAIVGHVALLPVAWALWMLGWIESYAVVLHGIEAWQRLSWISRIASRRVSAVITTTNYTGREFCFHNDLLNVRRVVIPLSCTIRAPRGPQKKRNGRLRLLTVTRLSSADSYKGVDTILFAVQRARDSGLDLTLDVVGDGDDKSRLAALARKLGINGSVRFCGQVADSELEERLGECHVFVLPSKKEGFGIVYLEAMASGLPCIAANHGGVPEVIEHSESGFLIEYGDVDRFVFFLRAVAESPALLSQLSQGAVRRAEIFRFENMADSWRKFVSEMETGELGADGRSRAKTRIGVSA